MTQGASALVAGAVAFRRLGFWIGSDWTEAQAAYERARELGMSKARAEAIGHVASCDDCWAFAKTIARKIGVHVRTVQRGFAEGRSFGLMRSARAGKTEIPPGASKPFQCGWSHRWVIGKGLAGARWKEAVDRARVRWLTSLTKRNAVPKSELALARARREPRRPPRGVTTVDWLNAELSELAARKTGPP